MKTQKFLQFISLVYLVQNDYSTCIFVELQLMFVKNLSASEKVIAHEGSSKHRFIRFSNMSVLHPRSFFLSKMTLKKYKKIKLWVDEESLRQDCKTCGRKNEKTTMVKKNCTKLLKFRMYPEIGPSKILDINRLQITNF
jgi:hypothetical protein